MTVRLDLNPARAVGPIFNLHLGVHYPGPFESLVDRKIGMTPAAGSGGYEPAFLSFGVGGLCGSLRREFNQIDALRLVLFAQSNRPYRQMQRIRPGLRQRLVGKQGIILCRVGNGASVIVYRLLPLLQGDMRIASAAVKPLEIASRGLGLLFGKSLDGRGVVGQLGLRIGPLAGKLGAQLEQPRVARLFSDPFIDGRPQGMQQLSGRRIIDEFLPSQLDDQGALATSAADRESDFGAGFSGKQLDESVEVFSG